MFSYAIIAVFLTSLISLIGIVTFSFRESVLRRLVFILVSLSVGALFGDAFIHMLPEVFESSVSKVTLSILALSGVLAFFVLEKFLHWRHAHGVSEETRETTHSHATGTVHPVGQLVLVGDAVHNFVDGIVIAAAFGVDVTVGVATTIAVILHEIPQEIADFGVLIHAGFTKWRALFYNFLSALAALLGVILMPLFGGLVDNIVPMALAFAAGGFIYVAGSDLVPELHKTKGFRDSLIQVLAVCAGVLIMLGLLVLE
jgi:zinc and cadmium transporter